MNTRAYLKAVILSLISFEAKEKLNETKKEKFLAFIETFSELNH